MEYRGRFALFLVIILGTVGARAVVGADSTESDEQRLTKYLKGTDPELVLAYLNSQVLTESAKNDLKKYIEQMGNPTFKLRQEASRELVKAGPAALPLLREALNNKENREIASRAKRCIEDINSGTGAELPPAAVRHLVKLKHPKAVDTFLAIYPTAVTESFQSELLHGLTSLGITGKEVNPSITKGLDDADAHRRAAAVQVLLKSADKDVRKPVKAKLKDADPTVRYHAAIGLVATERDAIPVLIGLIKDSPNPLHWQHAEECLYAIAGEQAKGIEVGEAKADDRKRIAASWENWWKAYGEQILLGQKEDHPIDTAVVTDTSGRVWEWRAEGKPRFDMKDATSPVDARILPGKRVLIADERGMRVSERDFTGKLIWEKTFDEGPVSVQRLPNGNTFVALYSRVVEVRRDGEIVSSLFIASDGRISDANKLSDGRIGCLTNDNKLFLLSPEGKVLKEVDTKSYGGVEALPDGHILISQINIGEIIEVDKDGKTVWECKIPGAWVGTRQPDGTTLVASKSLQKMYKVDKDGKKIIWEKSIDGHPHAMHWK